MHPIRKTNYHFVSKLYLIEANETMTEEERRNVGMTAGGGMKAGIRRRTTFFRKPDDPSRAAAYFLTCPGHTGRA